VKNPKPSCRGSVSGVPCGTGMADGAWGWGGSMYQVVVVVVVGRCTHEMQGGEGDWAETPKLSRCGSVSALPCEASTGDGE
jgi:hypothetical protein